MPERRYSSDVRAEQRRASRERVLEAARVLLVRRGFGGTTVEAIAGRAGVSVQTVYNVVGGKAAVLKAVYDTALAGDDEPVPMIERPTARAMRGAADGREFLRLYARMGREMYERAGPLLPILAEGAAGDREVRAFTGTIEDERAAGTAGVAGLVRERFGLRGDLTVGEAGDILWTLTSPDTALRLIHRRGWSLDRYEAWLGRTMADALLIEGD
ncbi:TetR/AcrR family transcriptional regulator [Actinoplanes bogorensis]|uniref:TetR/AcrR family transcriptional regulator n=1 Tax=Paractinoplanes bogorensis TaxID=1610840 RepID=A0ABS5YPI4_9ACTN|nr:TetR/AcrR family transcriptional regulator [Actinoplanes bogorensis]MBU2664608.1 TetR/AcrR family transcriptional regulator [Actinoplanes bogorensis]